MPTVQVDFYLLQDDAEQTKWYTACRLLEKAYSRGHRVFVYCDNQEDAEYLDEYLWTYKEDSFIPHNLQGEGPEPPPPIQIGYGNDPRGFGDILLNVSKTIPTFAEKFRRIMEIVPSEASAKETSREHYKTYRAKQFELKTHHL